MLRRREGFAPKLCRLVLQVTLYGSWAFGLFPFTLDPQTRQLRRHRWLLVYGVAINLFLLCIVVLLSEYSEETAQSLEVFQRNHLLGLMNVIIGVLALIASCGIILISFWKSGQALCIFNELLGLEHRHFGCLDVEDSSKFNLYVIQKGMSVVGELMGLVVVNYGMPEYTMSYLYLALLCLTQFCVNLVVTQIYLAILYIYRSVWLINRQLLGVVSRLRVDPLSDSSRIWLLLSLYGRLLALHKQMETTFNGQITLILTSALAGNIVVIYFLIVYTVSLGQLSISLAIFPYSLIMNVWDYWLSISVCDLTERTGRHTSTILKLFSDLEHTDEDLERSINEFTWLCSHRRFQFGLYGLCSVNSETGFQMIVTSFMYLLCLVQFDFMNL
ncbi:GL18469 [Drosophila persimilis]|uniref:Gustatory receptor n=1 Tax=Drosophila persimilis TaxID=7234 RepID=B4G7S6_DROPE|nr:putative gustatory receptor 22b [Drosophila persimilis]EDW29347.1 GL18469 [Drosophila persimilis]